MQKTTGREVTFLCKVCLNIEVMVSRAFVCLVLHATGLLGLDGISGVWKCLNDALDRIDITSC